MRAKNKQLEKALTYANSQYLLEMKRDPTNCGKIGHLPEKPRRKKKGVCLKPKKKSKARTTSKSNKKKAKITPFDAENLSTAVPSNNKKLKISKFSPSKRQPITPFDQGVKIEPEDNQVLGIKQEADDIYSQVED